MAYMLPKDNFYRHINTVPTRCIPQPKMEYIMDLYHSNPNKLRFDLNTLPVVELEALTEESTIEEAACAYVQNETNIIQSLKSGKFRAAEPYISLARSKYGQMKLKEITRRWAKLYQLEMVKEGKAGGTINGIVSKWRKLFQWLAEFEIVPMNPFSFISRVAKTDPKRKVRCLEEADTAEILEYLNGIKAYEGKRQGMYADMFKLGLLTAMRYNEICTLDKKRMDLEAKVPYARIPEQYSKTRVARDVILCPEAVEIINKGTEDKIFPCGYSALQAHLLRFSKLTGKSVFFHLTRHTAICDYAADAKSMSELQQFSGHASKGGVEPYANHDMAELRERVYSKLSAKEVA